MSQTPQPPETSTRSAVDQLREALIKGRDDAGFLVDTIRGAHSAAIRANANAGEVLLLDVIGQVGTLRQRVERIHEAIMADMDARSSTEGASFEEQQTSRGVRR